MSDSKRFSSEHNAEEESRNYSASYYEDFPFDADVRSRESAFDDRDSDDSSLVEYSTAYDNYEDSDENQENYSAEELDKSKKKVKPLSKKKKEKALSSFSDMQRPLKFALALFFIILSVLAVIGLVSVVNMIRAHFGRMDSPQEATNTLVEVVSNEDYESYKALLHDDSANRENLDLFQRLQSSINSAEDIMASNFVLLRLENGSQYLCSIFFDEEKGEYRIREIRQVPIESQSLFSSY